ncbi:MAG TPA: HK97 family phage prohead protease [Polyangiaceae bacterium]|nr:HK97 family phage prohead protease [Polyangiaceae bacterium]HMR74432.1 HK97 family phage prohead protease [Polyangiaceae bacterium]
MDQLIHRTHSVTTKAADKRTVQIIASTEAIDSYGEIVKQDWRLDRYRANPVVLWSHGRLGLLGPMKADDTLPIGFCSSVGVVGGRLEATVQFVTDAANPFAEKVFEGVRQGSIRGVSVGFRPGRIARVKQPDGSEVDELSENDLFEISFCPLPSNPEAVAKMAQRAAVERQALVRSLGKTPARPSLSARALARLRGEPRSLTGLSGAARIAAKARQR